MPTRACCFWICKQQNSLPFWFPFIAVLFHQEDRLHLILASLLLRSIGFFCFPFLFLLPGRLLKSLKEGDHTTLDGLAQEEPPPENGELDEKFSWTKHSVLFWIMDNFLPCVLRASTFRSNFDKSFPTNIWVVIHHSDIAFTLFVIQKDYDYCR